MFVILSTQTYSRIHVSLAIGVGTFPLSIVLVRSAG